MLDYSKPDELPAGWYVLVTSQPYTRHELVNHVVSGEGSPTPSHWEYPEDGTWCRHGNDEPNSDEWGRIIAGPLDLPNLARDLELVAKLWKTEDGTPIVPGLECRNEAGAKLWVSEPTWGGYGNIGIGDGRTVYGIWSAEAAKEKQA